jgi:diguanylate cyclase (GGDEF)-like protein/PAS domain S-box-containing protein
MIPFDAIPDAVLMVDADGFITRVNRELTDLFGYSPAELIGQPIEILLPASMRERHVPLRRVFQQNPRKRPMAGRAPLQARRKDGTEFPVEIMLSPLDQVHVLAVIRDTTTARDMSDRLRQLAYSDTLTGLPNRAALMRDVEELMQTSSPAGSTPMSVALFDLDSFKEINDTMGHSNGDSLLRGVVDRWSSVLAEGVRLYRLVGDEFVVLTTNSRDPREIARICHAMLQVLESAFEIAGMVVFVSASVGMALAPTDGLDGETLVANADLALYKAKRTGRGSAAFFDNTLRADAQARKELDTRLRQAYLNGELELHFQPQVRLADGTVVGSEALLRWNQGRTLVGPGAFIDMLATSPIARGVGRWILRTACQNATSWRGASWGVNRVSVNLFPIQFHDPSFVDEVKEVLAETGLPPDGLELEITENIILTSNATTRVAVDELRRLGVQLALDDFGTGYASLSLLTQMPLTRIKIDQSFIRGLPDDPHSIVLVRALITMAHAFGLTVIAEGVETAAQATFLRDEGCDEAQGFLFARPQPAAVFEASLINRPEEVPSKPARRS